MGAVPSCRSDFPGFPAPTGDLPDDRGGVPRAAPDLRHAIARFEIERVQTIDATMKGCEMVCPEPIGRGPSS